MEHYGNGILKEQGQTDLQSSSSLTLTGKPLLPSKGTVPDTQGYTPLQMAVRYGNLACMEQLLASESSPLVKDKCGSNCLHIAVMFKRKTIFKRLLEHPKITEMSNDTNNDGDLPIHLALQKGLSNFVTHLLKFTHYQVMDKDDNNYLHLAALASDEKTMEILLTYPFAESMMNAINSSGKTPLHCSAISGNPGCIYLLLDHGATVNKCHSGKTPFMYACSEGSLQCAKLLYEAHLFQRDWKDNQGNTALHLVAKSGSPNVTNYCLDEGMVISLNNEQKSFFDIIIEAVNSKLAITVLRHQRWQECLDTSCPTKPHPVMRLIDRIPSAFPMILNQSIQRSPLDPKHKDYWEKYNFKYISLPLAPLASTDTNEILRDDHEKDTSKSAQPSKPRVESRSAQPEVQLQIESSPQNEKSTERLQLEILPVIHKSDNHDTSSCLTEKEEKTSSSSTQSIHHTGDILGRKDDNVPSLQVLKLLAKNKRKQCLTHPLVDKYLFLKWKDYAHIPYLVKSWLVLLWAILLSVFIGMSPVPSQLEQTTVTNVSASDLPEEEISTAANVIRFITIFFTIVNGLFWLLNIYVLRLKLITHFIEEFEFWLNGCAIIATLMYLIPFSGLNSVIYEAGAIAIFTCWVDALVHLEIFGFIGIYVLMIMSITKNVLKVLIICLFFFFAFAFAFYILVGSVSELQFTNVGTSLVSSISSALAIIDLETFVAHESSLRFRVLVFIFYVLLLIMLPIVVINLLIGLAVGDIAQIQADAKINRQLFILTNLARLELFLSPIVLLRYNRESYVYYPNHAGGSWLKQMMRKIEDYILKTDIDAATSIEQLHVEEQACPEAREEDMAVSIEKLQSYVKQLSQTQDRMEMMLQKLMENQGLKLNVQCDHYKNTDMMS
jgi:transient receptor potential cation channel subfamily A protein 1